MFNAPYDDHMLTLDMHDTKGTLIINIQGNVINIMWTIFWEMGPTSLDYPLFNFFKFSSIVQLFKQIENISH
jgi:hypothetical protein